LQLLYWVSGAKLSAQLSSNAAQLNRLAAV
jgi:hypothetical protein